MLDIRNVPTCSAIFLRLVEKQRVDGKSDLQRFKCQIGNLILCHRSHLPSWKKSICERKAEIDSPIAEIISINFQVVKRRYFFVDCLAIYRYNLAVINFKQTKRTVDLIPRLSSVNTEFRLCRLIRRFLCVSI